jgi:hypothetical protein
VPAFSLRIVWVLDFLPAQSIVLIRVEFPFSNNAFEITAADFLEQTDALIFDVLSVDDARTVAILNQFIQPLLAFGRRCYPGRRLRRREWRFERAAYRLAGVSSIRGELRRPVLPVVVGGR